MRDLLPFRLLMLFVALPLVFLSQIYWFRSGWRLAARAKSSSWRVLLRGLWLMVFALLGAAMAVNFRMGARFWRNSGITALTSFWFTSGLFAYLGVKAVVAADWLWSHARRLWNHAAALGNHAAPHNGAPKRSQSPDPAAGDRAVNPHRRRFVLQGASVLAGSVPFASALYGFGVERLHYQVRHTEIPVPRLPERLAGLRIAQLSDVHMGNYMSAAEVRRAVDMANALHPDLTVVTGDFITRIGDPLEACIAELSRLRAPLGVWGTNGNHESYAGVEALAAELFQHYGMQLLRQESVMLAWRGQPINLIGIDYESSHDEDRGLHPQMSAIEPMVRRDMPNILLAHNPNCFRRAAELGIELMLTGHTHGGQVTVEILDHRFSPARFLTPYVAGLFRRPLGSEKRLSDRQAWAEAPTAPAAVVYVNRGLGTIGIPVRLGVPPEITLHTLIRA